MNKNDYTIVKYLKFHKPKIVKKIQTKMLIEIFKADYDIPKDKSEIRLLGEYFYKENKSLGYFIYGNKKEKLKEKFTIKNIKASLVRIIFIFNIILTDKSSMFEDCESLKSVFHSIKKIENKKLKEKENSFYKRQN